MVLPPFCSCICGCLVVNWSVYGGLRMCDGLFLLVSNFCRTCVYFTFCCFWFFDFFFFFLNVNSSYTSFMYKIMYSICGLIRPNLLRVK